MTKQVCCAVMTTGRYESVFARNCIESALSLCGIKLTVASGVFYGQCMQLLLTNAISNGYRYALTVDSDSIFTANDVARLLATIVTSDHIDALAALQPKRGTGEVLATRSAGDLDSDGSPILVDTAHFGLTLIDLRKLKELPRPWFVSTPNTEGDWLAGRVDEDLHFWTIWKAFGNNCYVDPLTRIGHLEEMVTMFDENMELVRLYPSEIKHEPHSLDDATRSA